MTARGHFAALWARRLLCAIHGFVEVFGNEQRNGTVCRSGALESFWC